MLRRRANQDHDQDPEARDDQFKVPEAVITTEETEDPDLTADIRPLIEEIEMEAGTDVTEEVIEIEETEEMIEETTEIVTDIIAIETPEKGEADPDLKGREDTQVTKRKISTARS